MTRNEAKAAMRHLAEILEPSELRQTFNREKPGRLIERVFGYEQNGNVNYNAVEKLFGWPAKIYSPNDGFVLGRKTRADLLAAIDALPGDEA